MWEDLIGKQGKVGDRVRIVWPSPRSMWREGEVERVEGAKYDIRFADGTVEEEYSPKKLNKETRLALKGYSKSTGQGGDFWPEINCQVWKEPQLNHVVA